MAALADGTGSQYVDLIPGARIEIAWRRGARSLPAEDVRRLTQRDDGAYRILYFDEVTDELVTQDPGGEPKQVSLDDCVVGGTTRAGVGGGPNDFGHQCDTRGGSSRSLPHPVPAK